MYKYGCANCPHNVFGHTDMDNPDNKPCLVIGCECPGFKYAPDAFEREEE